MKYFTKTSALTSVIAALLTTTSYAESFRANTFFQPQHPQAAAFAAFAESVAGASNGDIEFEVFYGGSLLPAQATLTGVRDGIADVAHHPATYTPSDLPIGNAIADLSFAVPDPFVMAFASTEFNILNPRLQEEWQRNGIVFGAGMSSAPYVLMCRTAVTDPGDLSGLRIRLPGGAWDRLALSADAVPVNVPSSEMYSGLDRGSIDCAANVGDGLRSFGLYDVVSHINSTEMGVYFAGPQYAFNPTFWRNRTPEQRELLFREMAKSVVQLQIAWDRAASEVLATAGEQGVTVVDSEEMRNFVADFAAADLETVEQLAREQHNIEDAGAILNEFSEVVQTWASRLEGVDRTDEEALTALLMEHVYDKLDPDTYGVW